MLRAGHARIRSFRVVPDVPEALKPLLEIAYNLWWTWHPEAVELFSRLDRELWESSNHNPVKTLGALPQEVLDRAAEDQSYLHALNLVHARFRQHLERRSWFERQYPHVTAREGDEAQKAIRIAYFSAEFGLTECLQIYSGGLGCLAGDHLKSASELGLPMCGVGLLYRNGYFHQYLNADGWQQERYPEIDFPNQPVRRLIDPDTGEQYRVSVELPGRHVVVGVWQVMVGRVPLYLLDTNFPENTPEDREITSTLYGGNNETRIKQEIVLGVGGVRVLAKIGEQPNVYHANEGHAAFLSLERIARLREEHGVSFSEARAAAASNQLFTTHTPVPAGIDTFPPEMVLEYIRPLQQRLGIDDNNLLGLGRSNPFDMDEFFSMAVLAIRTCNFANGVSRLHGHVARGMWRNLWPGVPENEVPIGHVTNGVHPRSWISYDLIQLFDRYIGPEWQLDPTDYEAWDRVQNIPDEELWRAQERAREKLITWCRSRIRAQLTKRGVASDEVERAAAALDPDILTIGFARRFATYKRGTLLMRDAERLKAILTNADRPLQVIIAGKAHPADRPGKELIRAIVKKFSGSEFEHRIVFIEDYDIEVCRRLIQGCDVWLNTPKRGMEASGTSGMKIAMNGGLNCSILDGWWDEAYHASVGFAIGQGETYADGEEQDSIESRALYDLLERRMIPEFYDRDSYGLPRKWIERMKSSIAFNTPRFSTNRMVADYAERYYLIAQGLGNRLTADDLSESRGLAAQLEKLHHGWGGVRVLEVVSDAGSAVPIRSKVNVRARVSLGGLTPSDVYVQACFGEVSSMGDLRIESRSELRHMGEDDSTAREGEYVFGGTFSADGSGRRGFAVRVVPRDERLLGTLVPGLIKWDDGDPRSGPSEADEVEDAVVSSSLSEG